MGDGVHVMRNSLLALVCTAALAAGAIADEYKEAVVKGIKNGRFVFEVNGQEIQISPGSTAWKGFDIDGRQLTEFGHNYRVMKTGNVVNVITAKKRGNEFIQEIQLVKGELAEVGKARTNTSSKTSQDAKGSRKGSAQNEQTYSGAIIQSVSGNRVVLVVGDKEVAVVKPN
jgi:hypothetical protein